MVGVSVKHSAIGILCIVILDDCEQLDAYEGVLTLRLSVVRAHDQFETRYPPVSAELEGLRQCSESTYSN